MTIRKTYQLFEDEDRILVYEDILNSNGQIVSYRDLQSPNSMEGISDYDQNGRLILEKEMIDGKEGSRTEYHYDEEGNVIKRSLFVADELFEEIVIEYLSSGMVRKVYHYGEEIERMAETANGDKFVREFFEASVLVERHTGMFDQNTSKESVEITDENNQLVAIRESYYDHDNNILKYEEKNSTGLLLVMSEYQYRNGEVIFEKHEDHNEGKYYQVDYEYDISNNLVSQEVRSSSGKLLEYQKMAYDDQNRLIQEYGYSLGSFNTIYGTYAQGNKYFFEHEYMDQSVLKEMEA